MDLKQARKAAERVEDKLLTLAEDAAAILRAPKDLRDVAEANIVMMKMNGLRPHLRRPFRLYEKASLGKGLPFQPKSNRDDQRLDRYFRGVRFRLRYWRVFEQAVVNQLTADGGALFPPPPSEDPYYLRMAAAMHSMELAFHALANPHAQSDSARDLGYFPDIPLPTEVFVENIHAAYRICLAQGRPRPLRFIDVGGGGGTKVHLAATYFDLADSLEYDPDYAAAAGRMFEVVGAQRCRSIEGDGLTFERYGDYDVIYFYRPISDQPLLHQLEEKIVREARPGTVLVAPYDFFIPRAEALGVTRIEDWVYVTGIDAAEAETLRRRAQETGRDVAPAGLAAEPRVGFWRPIVEAALGNGWRPPMMKFKPTDALTRWDEG